MCQLLEDLFFQNKQTAYHLKPQFILAKQNKNHCELKEDQIQKVKIGVWKDQSFMKNIQNQNIYASNLNIHSLKQLNIKIKTKNLPFQALKFIELYHRNSKILEICFEQVIKSLRLNIIVKLKVDFIFNFIQICVYLGKQQGFTNIPFKNARKQILKKFLLINQQNIFNGLRIKLNTQNGHLCFQNSVKIDLKNFLGLFESHFNLKNNSVILKGQKQKYLRNQKTHQISQQLFREIEKDSKNNQIMQKFLIQMIKSSISSVQQIIKNQIPEILDFSKEKIGLSYIFRLNNSSNKNLYKDTQQMKKKYKTNIKNHIKTYQKICSSHIHFGFSSKAQQASYPSVQKSNLQETNLKKFLQNINHELNEPSLRLFYENQVSLIGVENIQKFYDFQGDQTTLYSKYLRTPVPKAAVSGQNKYIFNYISVTNPQKVTLKNIGLQGGFSKIQICKLTYNYLDISEFQKAKQENEHQNEQQNQQISDNRKKPNSDAPLTESELFLDYVANNYHLKNNALSQIQNNSLIQIQKEKLTKIIGVKIPKSNIQNKSHEKQIYKNQNQKEIVSLFKNGSSAYILKYYLSFQKDLPIKNKLLMDYVPNSLPLSVYNQIHKQTLSLNSKIHLLVNISNSIRFINDYQVTHLDVSLNNILVVKDFLTKLIDFGQAFSRKFKKIRKYSPSYTMPFCAPQIFNKSYWQKFTAKQDTFSLGMIIFYIFFEDFPFFSSEELQKAYKNKEFQKKIMLAPQRIQTYGDNATNKMMNLILNIFFKCINKQPENRCEPSWITVLFKILYNSRNLNGTSYFN